MSVYTRVFNTTEGVKVLHAKTEEFLERDTQQHFPGVEHFDCRPSDLPARKTSTGECLRCKWVFNSALKKVMVDTRLVCNHDRVQKLEQVINTGTTEQAVAAMIALKRLEQK